jgi:hypothetical protein
MSKRTAPALSPEAIAIREAETATSRYSLTLAARSPEPSVDHALRLGEILSHLEARDISASYRVASPLPTGIVEWVSL